MGVVTRRSNTGLKNGANSKETTQEASSSSSSSPSTSTDELDKMDSKSSSAGKSLKERGRITTSFYICVSSVLLLQYFSGLWSEQTIKSYIQSIVTSARTIGDMTVYTNDILKSTAAGEYLEWKEYASFATVVLLVFSIFYVFIGAPFMAGFWTGTRSRKQVIHRYMGLVWLAQYALAWTEFLTNYQNGASSSLMPHFIALNGLIQGWSAYFSFKVLPELDDAGYYADRAVISRNFVHENIFFTLMTLFGSIYYFEGPRETLRSTVPGRVLEYIFVFWPYILLRPHFPTTRFKDAGTTHKGRTARNEKFYAYATVAVKIFFLWAKYFLGFYMNFVIFLDQVTEENWKFMHGMFLLNVGTVSLAVFLHTLRFRKVLPPRFTFSLYLLQIYATFSAIPFAYDMFINHGKLCALALAGLLGNMTRLRSVHVVWCFVTMCLLSYDGIKW